MKNHQSLLFLLLCIAPLSSMAWWGNQPPPNYQNMPPQYFMPQGNFPMQPHPQPYFQPPNFQQQNPRNSSVMVTNGKMTSIQSRQKETNNAFIVEITIKGIDPNLLDVAVKDQRLFIKSTASKIVTNQSANSTSYSYSSNQFQQSYSIPHNVNLQKMAIERSAELVRVILPKIKQ